VNHSEISRQLAELIAENQRGSTALFETEKALAEAEYELDTIEAKAFLKAQGTVADRNALARLESAENRLQRDLRRAEHNRVKVKIKAIETGIMALGTQAKLMQSEARL
jgi:NADPH-dependent 7-cyano-7-deazaguanine reductase QueF-like protein